jgi:hypothetical protein
MGILKSVSKYGLALPVGIGNLITKGISAITKKDYGRTTLEQASQTPFGKVLGSSIVGTASTLGVIVAGPTSVLKAITPKTILGKGAGILTAGIAVKSPKVVSAILESPFKIFETGQKIGTAIEELPKEVQDSAEGLGKYGLIGAGIGALGTGLIGGLALGGSEKIKEIKETYLTPVAPSKMPIIEESEVETPLSSVQTPQETTPILSDSKPKKRKKKARETPRQTISQRVDVRVGVNANNKKYIKNDIHLNKWNSHQ